MIFKESIKDVYDTIEKIKDIRSGAYIGTDGLFDSKTVKLYVEQLRSLSKAEAEASLSSVGLTRSQKAQVLSSLELNDLYFKPNNFILVKQSLTIIKLLFLEKPIILFFYF